MSNRYLPIILLAAAGVRFALLAAAWNHPERAFEPDSKGYVALAESLAHHNAFGRDGRAEIYRTPGYPLLLIPSFAFRNNYWRAALVGQILFDVLLVYLTYLLASMLAGPAAGLWAAALQAISTVAIASSLRLLSDGPFAVLATLAACLMVHHLRSGAWWSLLCSAGVLSAACYVRPAGIALAAVFAAAALLRRPRLRRAGAFAGIVIAALAPWVVRNHVAAGYTGFSSFAGDSMYFHAVPALQGRLGRGNAAALRARLKAKAEAQENQADAPQVGAAAAERRRKALDAVAAHPLTYAGLHLRGCLNVYLPGAADVLETMGLTSGQRGTIDVLRKQGAWAAARHYFGENRAAVLIAIPMVAALAIKYLAAIICAVARLRLRMPAEGWLILGVVAVCTLLPGASAVPRFRVPFEPLLSAAGGCGIAIVISAIRRGKGVRNLFST